MKVKELASICGVSEQAIRQFFSRNNFTKVNGKWQPTEQEVESLLSYYNVDISQAAKADESTFEPESSLVSLLGKQLATLQEQLEVKDKQIEELQGTISKQQSTIDNLIESNKALAAANAVQIAADKKPLLVEPQEQTQEQVIESEPPQEKKGFWARLFGL